MTLNYLNLRNTFFLQVLFSIFLIVGCNNSSRHSSSSKNDFEDGEYCAEIHYYYSKTWTSSDYTLLVEVEDGKLIKILWSNGGWLDDTHFEPPNIEDGTTEFTSYKGVEYSVNIIGSAGGCNTSSSSIDEDELIQDRKNKQKRIEEEEKAKREEEEEENRKRQQEEDDNNKENDGDEDN